MFFKNRDIVWMPLLGKDCLSIALSQEFAVACSKVKLSGIVHFEREIWNRSQLPGEMPPNFLHLPDGNILPWGFYKNDDGIWLSSGGSPLAVIDEKDAVVYNGHNEERARLWLMHAFQAWVDGAIALTSWK